MINNVSTKYGQSFMGVTAYAMHDKRNEQQMVEDAVKPGIDTQGQTSNRVAWTDTRNLATTDPMTAARVMSYYAIERENIKRANGIKSTGRKAKGPVCHISFSWHPEQGGEITREDMEKFAQGALKALGFEKQPAIIICHQDEPQPHIHLIVSRINSDNGKMVNAYYDHRKLSRYANKYVKSLNKDYCPNRDINEKFREQQRRKRQDAQIAVRDENPPRNMHELEQATVNDNQAKTELIHQQRAGAATLFKYRDSVRRQQEEEWQEFESEHDQTIEQLKTENRVAIRRAVRIYTDHYREELQQVKSQHRQQQKDFAKDENRAFGKLRNMLRMDYRTLFKNYEIERKKTGRTVLQAAFKVLGNAGTRLESFMARQSATEKVLLRSKEGDEKKSIREIDTLTNQRLAAEKQAFLAKRETLLDRHDSQDAEISNRWDQHTAKYKSQWKKILEPGSPGQQWKSGDLVAQMKAEMEQAKQQRHRRRH